MLLGNGAFASVEDGKKAIVKVKLPPALANSGLFKTGVEVREEDE